jgi:hypothetical protein
MTWLIWRQQRSAARVLIAMLILLAALLLVSGWRIADDFQGLGLPSCLAHQNATGCDIAFSAFTQRYGLFASAAVMWLNAVPLLLGAFVGAPLIAREVEQHTQHLVWTQGITRTRWAAMTLLLLFAVCLGCAALLIVLLTWWRGPFDQLPGGRMSPTGFDVEGIVPLGYMAFALALGIAAGTLIRRTVPAMVATVAAFLAVRLPVEIWLRPRYMQPAIVIWDPAQPQGQVRAAWSDWVLSDGHWFDRVGKSVDLATVFRTCTSAPTTGGFGFTPGDAFTQCTHAHGWVIYTIFQPADRFWLFQGIETAIFVGLALALLALTFWWVRARIS